MAKKKTPSNTETALAPQELSRAVTNDPSLSTDEFQLGDRTFKVCDLNYKEYVKFTSLVAPLIEGLASKLSKSTGISVPGIDLSGFGPSSLLRFASDDLPEMARMVCAKSDPNITVEQVMELGKTPIVLAEVVMKQMVRNNIIGDFSRLFRLLLPLMPKTAPQA
jgi:hypothetical protein